MKIKSVKFNNKKKGFEASASGKTYVFPYVKVRPSRHRTTRLPVRMWTKSLAAKDSPTNFNRGKTGTVHVEQVLEYNRDPSHVPPAEPEA